MEDDYKKISKCYDLLSSVYSLGAVRRCREFVLKEIKLGMNICFLGVGQGKEAIKSMEQGARVTVVDNSSTMLEMFRSRLKKSNIGLETQVKIHHEDVLEFSAYNEGKFDIVVIHFFLNVFAERKMVEVLESVSTLCHPSGQLVIADFWQDDEASSVVQWMQRGYWNVALFIFRRIVKNPTHSIYVYDGFLGKQGFSIVKEKSFKVLGIPMFRSIVVKNSKR